MKYFLAFREEFSGYDCGGHLQTYIVAANNEQEVFDLLDDRSEGEKENNYRPNVDPTTIKELILPVLTRKKKPFIFI